MAVGYIKRGLWAGVVTFILAVDRHLKQYQEQSSVPKDCQIRMSAMNGNTLHQPQNMSGQVVLHQSLSQNAPGQMMLYQQPQPQPYPTQQSTDPRPQPVQQTPATAHRKKKNSKSQVGGPLRKGLENLAKLVERKIDHQIESARVRAYNADQRLVARANSFKTPPPQVNLERKQYA